MTEKTRHSDEGGGGSYWRFMAMVSTSTVIRATTRRTARAKATVHRVGAAVSLAGAAAAAWASRRGARRTATPATQTL